MRDNKPAGSDYLVWYCGHCASDQPPTWTSVCGTCGAPMVIRDSRRETQGDAQRKWMDIVKKR